MAQAAALAGPVLARTLRRAPAGTSPFLAWPLVCGPAVAERTRAVNFTQGILQVQVPDAGWRAELRALAPQYVAVINRYAVEKVERIEFVI
jgi:predicted nucleic acid-binding Zn ribbon protein